jgi:putative membrane protein
MDEESDATRRTLLANERTFLAWWRGALTAIAVSLGAGALIPQLTTAERWPFVSVGVGFGVLAVAFVVYGSWRHRAVEDALLRGEFPRVHRRVILAFAVLGVILSLLTILAILIVL